MYQVFIHQSYIALAIASTEVSLFDELNQELFLLINNIANQFLWLDNVVIMTAEYMPFGFIAVLLFLWLGKKRYQKINSLYAGYTVLLALSINWFIAIFYFHPRPFSDGIGTMLIQHAPDASFPSDHTTFLFSIALTLFVLRETRKLGLLLFAMATLGGIARVYCGVHYPFDIFGALFTSVLASFIVISFKHELSVVNHFAINFYQHLLDTWTNALIDKTHLLHLSFLPKNKRH